MIDLQARNRLDPRKWVGNDIVVHQSALVRRGNKTLDFGGHRIEPALRDDVPWEWVCHYLATGRGDRGGRIVNRVLQNASAHDIGTEHAVRKDRAEIAVAHRTGRHRLERERGVFLPVLFPTEEKEGLVAAVV